jgi:glycosyltransferase involved in cell wall biosynthesis
MARILQIAGVASRIPSLSANSIQVMRMADAFSGLGHQVKLVVPHGKGPLAGGDVADPHAFYGVEPRFAIERVWTPGIGRIGVLAFAWAARTIAARGDFDIIFCRNSLASLLLARAGIHHLFEAHHYRLAGRVDHWHLPALRTPYVERLVLLSSALEAPFAAHGVATGKMLVAPDGVADGWLDEPPANEAVALARSRLGAGEETPLSLYVGSLGPLKGINTLIAAAHRLPEQSFAVVGGPSGEQVDEYRHLAGANVRFTGPVPPVEVPPLLAAADCLVLPHSSASARSHLSPLKIFEYLAAGRAIVATDLPATREVLTDGVNALIVPPDDPERLAAAIARLAGDPELRARLGEAARATARQHTWSARARRILDGLPAAPAAGLRLAHLLNSFHPLVGGAERQAAALAREQVAHGHRPLVLTRRRRGLPGLDALGAIPIHRVPVGRFGALGFIASGLGFLLTRCRRLDLVHAHQARGNAVLGYLARALGGPPLVVKLAGLDLPESGGPLSRARLAILRRADAVVALTPAMRDALRGLGVARERLHLIPNGVDLERFLPADENARRAARQNLGLPPEVPLVLFVGRLEAVKGPDLLIEAWARLQTDPAALVLVGDGPLRSELTRAVNSERLRFVGEVEDTAAYYRAADLMVVPSRSEGLSNTLLEAMASGLAVLATRVPGNVQVIEDGKTGRLVAPHPESLAQALDELLADRVTRSRLGQAAAVTVRERYALSATASAYEALFQQLASARKG